MTLTITSEMKCSMLMEVDNTDHNIKDEMFNADGGRQH